MDIHTNMMVVYWRLVFLKQTRKVSVSNLVSNKVFYSRKKYQNKAHLKIICLTLN